MRMPRDSSNPRRISASCPVPERLRRCTPSANSRRLRATFAAPPALKVSRCTSTTGTGASGEIRPTFPQINSSSIISPTTRILRAGFRSCSARVRFIPGVKPRGIPVANCGLQRRRISRSDASPESPLHSPNRVEATVSIRSSHRAGTLFTADTPVSLVRTAGHFRGMVTRRRAVGRSVVAKDHGFGAVTVAANDSRTCAQRSPDFEVAGAFESELHI